MIELNKVYHGDCLEVMKEIESKSIDMILCDLPYGTTQCKWDTVIPFGPLWEQYKRIIKDNGAIVLFADEPFTSIMIASNIKMFKYRITWDKDKAGGFLNSKIMPLKQTEDICVFGKSKIKYFPIMKKADTDRIRPNTNGGKRSLNYGHISEVKNDINYDNTLRFPTNLIKFSRNGQECNPTKIIHPTQKPVALFEYLIKTYTNEGDLVLDNCAGSGTTGVACQNLNRNFILIEKELEYVNIINDRIKNIFTK